MEDQLEYAIACREAGRFDDAVTALRELVAQSPTHIVAWATLAHVLLLAQRDDEAWHALGRAQELGAQEPVVLRNHARLLLKRGSFAEALHVAAQAYGVEPSHVEGGLVLASALMALGHLQKAADLITAVVSGKPDFAEAYVIRAQVRVRGNDFAGSLADFELALKLKPHLKQLWSMTGRLRCQLGDYAGAAAAIDEAIGFEPGNSELLLMQADLMQRLGVPRRALDLFDAVCALSPHDMRGWFGAGVVHQQSQRMQDARRAFARARAIEPRNKDVVFRLGQSAFACKEMNEALGCFNQVIDGGVVNSPVFNSRGDVYFALKNFGDAEADYRRALDLSPAAAEAQFNFANRLKNLGQVEAAIGHYRRAIDLKPEFGAAHFNLANTYYDTSKLENAAEHYLLALHADPALVQACINLAGVYVDMGKVDLANIYYRNAIGLKGDAADVYFDYGNSLLSADDPLGAEAAFRIASQLEPEGAGLLAGVHLAVMSYLDHDVEACEELLSRTHLIQAANEDRFRNASAYWRYLRALLPLVAAGQAASRAESVVRDAFVLGESHCLSVHGLVTRHPEGSQCWKARWIPGCKQWHLASPSPNKYKYQFERIVSKLPQAPTLLLTFGEIDCRQDEGILRVAAKKGVEHIPGIIQSTVSGYLDYVEMALKELQPRIIICGVPAPNVSGLHDGEGLIGLIREFNACLAAQVARRHWRFLDVYAVSNRGDGIADGSAHIDQFHLYPATIATAFEWL